MKYIQKKSPPSELVRYRNTPGATYLDMHDNHHDIYELTRLSLAEEQGYICCYCGQRISGFEGTQIEHIFPKGTVAYTKMQLDYETNLIASCDGGKFIRRTNSLITVNELHCDTKKYDNPIPVTPLQKDCEEKFLFNEHGEILGIGSDAEATIEILNLCSPILKNKRKAAIDAYSMFTEIDWKDEIIKLNNRNSKGEFVEFCFVIQQYIRMFKISFDKNKGNI